MNTTIDLTRTDRTSGTSNDRVTDRAAARLRSSGRRLNPAVALTAAAVLSVTADVSYAQQPLTTQIPVERTVGDGFGGTTEHYSIDQHGTLAVSPTEYVSVGMRTLMSGGRGLHVLRYGTNHIPLSGGEALLVPVGSTDIVGYSVDTMANGDLLVAGELEDTLSSNGLMNVFVCRMSRNLSTIYWSKLLRGSLSNTPSVTARELRDGTIIVAHNEWPAPNGDLAPGYGRLTRLSANGALIWQRRYGVPNAPFGQIRFADVRQEPQSSGTDLWVAGSATDLFDSQAMVLEIDLNGGYPLGECGYLYPHPDFENTSFASIYFDQRPSSPFYTMVCAGAAIGANFSDTARPRVIDLPAGGGAANWDHVFDTYMTPAPTALTVRRGSYASSPARVIVAGTNTQSLSSVQEACLIELDGNSSGAFSHGWTFGNGVPPYTRFNDIADAQVMVGGRHADINGDGVVNLLDPVELYYAGRGASSCAERFEAPDLGPGDWAYFCPQTTPEEQIMDFALMDAPHASYDQTICRWRLPDPVAAPKIPFP
ncbi:MAG: hypothetical protein HRF50_13075 [Phycisphaerae bacterium]|jgi:hypothetical protein